MGRKSIRPVIYAVNRPPSDRRRITSTAPAVVLPEPRQTASQMRHESCEPDTRNLILAPVQLSIRCPAASFWLPSETVEGREEWCELHLGPNLPVLTNNSNMLLLDNRERQGERDSGRVSGAQGYDCTAPIKCHGLE
jgi:hypothetical protein